MKFPIRAGIASQETVKRNDPDSPFEYKSVPKFTPGPDADEHYGDVYDEIQDADGKTLLEYAGCGSHRFTIDPEFAAWLASQSPGEWPVDINDAPMTEEEIDAACAEAEADEKRFANSDDSLEERGE